MSTHRISIKTIHRIWEKDMHTCNNKLINNLIFKNMYHLMRAGKTLILYKSIS